MHSHTPPAVACAASAYISSRDDLVSVFSDHPCLYRGHGHQDHIGPSAAARGTFTGLRALAGAAEGGGTCGARQQRNEQPLGSNDGKYVAGSFWESQDLPAVEGGEVNEVPRGGLPPECPNAL